MIIHLLLDRDSICTSETERSKHPLQLELMKLTLMKILTLWKITKLKSIINQIRSKDLILQMYLITTKFHRLPKFSKTSQINQSAMYKLTANRIPLKANLKSKIS